MQTQTKRVLLYARVSTGRQAEKDLSIPDQLRQLHAYCDQNHYVVVEDYVEKGASATDDNRPEFQRMMADIFEQRVEVDAILVLTTSRFYRNAYGAAKWKYDLRRLGIRVVAITQDVGEPDSPSGELVEGIFALIDQNESRMIGYHTLRGMKENARRGFFNGAKPPFGYRVVETSDDRGNVKRVLAVDPDEAELVRRVFDLYVCEGLGTVTIAQRLNEQGCARRGRPWGASQVLRVLSNETYLGKAAFNRYDSRNKVKRPPTEWILIDVEPLVEEEMFRQAQELRAMKTPEKKAGRTHTSPLLLTGLLRCGRCGSSMVAATGKGGKYGYYVCAKTKRDGKAACPGHRAPVKGFETEVIEAIVDTAFNMDNVRALAKGVRSELADRRRPVRGLKRELAAIERKLAMYYEAFESGDMKAQHLEERVRGLKEERNRVQAELEERQSIDPIPESVLERENIEKVQAYLKRMFWESPGPVIKQWLGLFIDHIVMRGDELEVVGKTAGVLAVLEQRENVRTGDVTPVRTSLRKWQPVGESNPCDGTENPAS